MVINIIMYTIYIYKIYYNTYVQKYNIYYFILHYMLTI